MFHWSNKRIFFYKCTIFEKHSTKTDKTIERYTGIYIARDHGAQVCLSGRIQNT